MSDHVTDPLQKLLDQTAQDRRGNVDLSEQQRTARTKRNYQRAARAAEKTRRRLIAEGALINTGRRIIKTKPKS